jgi:hypothetical protein
MNLTIVAVDSFSVDKDFNIDDINSFSVALNSFSIANNFFIKALGSFIKTIGLLIF